MDIIKISNYSSMSNSATTGANPPQLQDTTTSGGGGFMSSINERSGGGKSGEKKEDLLDKSVDSVQERILKQGQQDNESAAEQFKDEQISDSIRRAFKQTTGNDFPVDDK